MGFDEETTLNAFGIAGSHSAGLIEYTKTGGSVKRIHSAIPAQAGVRSALFAKAGIDVNAEGETLLRQLATVQPSSQTHLDVFGGQVARWVLALSVALVAGNVAVQGWAHLDDAFLWAVALAVAFALSVSASEGIEAPVSGGQVLSVVILMGLVSEAWPFLRRLGRRVAKPEAEGGRP